MVAVTSSGVAVSSISVPTCPGLIESGGAYSTGWVPRSNSGTASSPSLDVPNAASTADPLALRSRPSIHISRPISPNRTSSNPPATPPVSGVTAKVIATFRPPKMLGSAFGNRTL